MTGKPVVIYNPKAGRGRAAALETTLQERLPPGAEILVTCAAGDAAELAQAAIRSGCRWIISGGGDGTIHEIAGGILNSGHQDVVFTPLPLGSANDYAYSLGLIDWWQQHRGWDVLQCMKVDVGRIRSGDKSQWFVNCCGIGFNGMVTAEARDIRWLRGIPLYGLAVIKALWKHYDAPVMTFALDGQVWTAPTLASTIGIGQREGGFPLTASARLDDGLFDLLHVSDIRRLDLIRHFPGMISGHLPKDHPKLRFERGRKLNVDSPKPLCVHLDGEFFCTPKDGVLSLEIEMFPRALSVAFDAPGLYGGSHSE